MLLLRLMSHHCQQCDLQSLVGPSWGTKYGPASQWSKFALYKACSPGHVLTIIGLGDFVHLAPGQWKFTISDTMVEYATADKNKDDMGQKTGMRIKVVEFPVHGNKIVHKQDG